MPKTSAACPKCRQPVVVELTRLFDLNTDPDAKQKLLSGSANFIACPSCGYQGPIPTPIVYHDPDKELLLTFFPPELSIPVNEQEKMIGPLIKKVVDDLPLEKRKAYIFRPQTMLTQQRLFEQILEADGITPEMMKAQQDRLSLIQRLAMISEEALPEAITQEDALIDDQLFMLLSKLIEASSAGNDENSANKLGVLHQHLLENSTFGKKVKEQTRETQKAIADLQEADKKGLTRESLLDLVLNAAESDVQLVTIVSMARGGMDYQFFQLLTDKIDHADSEKGKSLVELRDKLLDLTQEIDNAIKEQTAQAQVLLREIIESENIEEAAQKALPKMTQAFVELIRMELQEAQKTKDQYRLDKLGKIVAVVQSAGTSSAYISLIETLIQAPDDSSLNSILDDANEMINDEFIQFLTGLTNQIEASGNQPEATKRLKEIYKVILGRSMKKNLEQDTK